MKRRTGKKKPGKKKILEETGNLQGQKETQVKSKNYDGHSQRNKRRYHIHKTRTECHETREQEFFNSKNFTSESWKSIERLQDKLKEKTSGEKENTLNVNNGKEHALSQTAASTLLHPIIKKSK